MIRLRPSQLPDGSSRNPPPTAPSDPVPGVEGPDQAPVDQAPLDQAPLDRAATPAGIGDARSTSQEAHPSRQGDASPLNPPRQTLHGPTSNQAAQVIAEPVRVAFERLIGVGVLICRHDGEIQWANRFARTALRIAFPAGREQPALAGRHISGVLDLDASAWGMLSKDLLATHSGSDPSTSSSTHPWHDTTSADQRPDPARQQPPSTPLVQESPILRSVALGPACRSPEPTGNESLAGRRFDVAASHWGDRLLITLTDGTLAHRQQVELSELRAKLGESERVRARLSDLRAELSDASGDQEMIGESAPLRRVREQVARVAPSNTTVLINGETGSGKELVARALHHSSQRRTQAFVAVNCAAMPETLLESELFGHERGAFTSADRRKLGKFELADGGTLFLDEVAEMPLTAQAKLLRVLQERTFERVGGTEPVKVDVRLIAASHRDLARQVERGRFREDLFYRLAVFRIDVPTLRDRKEDLRPLIAHLHERFAKRLAKPVLPIAERSLRRLMAYSWPGNVRELANAVERATLLSEGAELDIELPQGPLPNQLDGRSAGSLPGSAASPADGGNGQASDILLDLSLEQLQRLQIVHALEKCSYRVFGEDGAAAALDINPRTLLSRMDKFGIPRPRIARASGE